MVTYPQAVLAAQQLLCPQLLQLAGDDGVDSLQSDWVFVVHVHCAALQSQLTCGCGLVTGQMFFL